MFSHGLVYLWLKSTGFFPMLPQGSHTSASRVHVFIFPNGIELGGLGCLCFFEFWLYLKLKQKAKFRG